MGMIGLIAPGLVLLNPGDAVLMLQHAINWEPEQEVVLVTTAIQDSCK
jgi:hypothetical protein